MSAAVPDQPWSGILNQVLYGLAYVREPDDATAHVFAQRMLDRRIFPSGPRAYLDALPQALRAPRLLAATAPVGGHDEATVRGFCGRVVHHLEATSASTDASGWPPERFAVLPARDWPWATTPVTAVITAGLPEVSARTWNIFEFMHSMAGVVPVLVLRLRTGEVIALVVSTGPSPSDRRRTMLKVLEGDPPAAVASFRHLTGFTERRLVPPEAIAPATTATHEHASAHGGELELFRVFVADGRLFWADTGTALDTTLGTTLRPGPNRAIYVMDSQANLYASLVESIAGFHHSSLLAGRPTAGAGEIVAQTGRLVEISGRSASYPVTHAGLDRVLAALATDGLPIDTAAVHRG